MNRDAIAPISEDSNLLKKVDESEKPSASNSAVESESSSEEENSEELN